jgi:hypothetical protein
VTRQWLHEQQLPANSGKYLEYMLELAWVRATDPAKADASVYRNGNASDTGQTKVAIASEAVDSIKAFIADAADQRKDDENGGGNSDNNNNNNGNDNNDTGNNGGNGNNNAGDGNGDSGSNNNPGGDNAGTGNNNSAGGNNTNTSGTLSSNASNKNSASNSARSTTGGSGGAGSVSSDEANIDDLDSESYESLAEPPVAEDLEGIDRSEVPLSNSIGGDENGERGNGVSPWIPIAIVVLAGASITAIIVRTAAVLKR